MGMWLFRRGYDSQGDRVLFVLAPRGMSGFLHSKEEYIRCCESWINVFLPDSEYYCIFKFIYASNWQALQHTFDSTINEDTLLCYVNIYRRHPSPSKIPRICHHVKFPQRYGSIGRKRITNLEKWKKYNVAAELRLFFQRYAHRKLFSIHMKANKRMMRYFEGALLSFQDTSRKDYFKRSVGSFVEGLKNDFDIQMIDAYQIQNTKLSDGYQQRCALIERGLKHPQKVNERYLYHGTSMENIPQIISNGFLRQYAARESWYGQGCYFSMYASYSAMPRYAKPNADGVQFVFLCSVICGESCEGSKYMKVPRTKPGTMHHYETTVDNVRNPSIFVTFSDNQALPVYLIAFKRRN